MISVKKTHQMWLEGGGRRASAKTAQQRLCVNRLPTSSPHDAENEVGDDSVGQPVSSEFGKNNPAKARFWPRLDFGLGCTHFQCDYAKKSDLFPPLSVGDAPRRRRRSRSSPRTGYRAETTFTMLHLFQRASTNGIPEKRKLPRPEIREVS